MNGCTLCPRHCNVNRVDTTGFCGALAEPEVASVCVHNGEEPPLNPIINIFFTHCNLQCIYCQNWQISSKSSLTSTTSIASLANRIVDLHTSHFSHSSLLGLVTATHYANRIKDILNAVHQRGFYPTVVYNCGGYESVETLRSIEGLVDIYLPDFKYMDPSLAADYSHASDYPEVATAALIEMKRQVGSGLKCDEKGIAYRGLIVRHLVLPGHTDNSIQCLNWLADNFPPTLRLSLMAQYYPPRTELPAPLNRNVTPEEYDTVVNHAISLGLTDGWIQELSAESHYRPDFSNNENPFEK